MRAHKIIIVEDERIVAADIETSLKAMGYEVVASVATGEKAISAVMENLPDLVLMDIHLKGQMNGIEEAGRIHSECDVPVVYLTAYADDDTLANAKLTEPYGYIVKPFEDRELKSIIEIALYKHQMTRKVKEGERKLLTLMSNIPGMVYRCENDPNRTAAFVSDGCIGLTGFSPSELVGDTRLSLNDLILPEDRSLVRSQVKHALEEHRHFEMTYRIQTKSGEEKWIWEKGCGVFDEKGTLRHLEGLFTDITDLKKIEARLRQTRKIEAMGTLAGGIAHDFNNLLAVVLGFTELGLDQVDRDSLLHDNLTAVLKAGYRAKDLVKQILTFSHHAEQEFKPIHINPLVQDAVRMLRSTLPVSIEIDTDIDSDIHTVIGDATQIHQIILNLGSNAAHAMSENGGVLKLTLDTTDTRQGVGLPNLELIESRYVRITVSDTGCGISKKDLDIVFDPYFTTKEKGKGTGLGLSVVHGIVKAHSGIITVDSEVNRGSQFQVYLPIAKGMGTVDTVKRDKQAPGGKEHLLVVDDEPQIVAMQRMRLERLGYSVTDFTDSREAWKAFQSEPETYDLVITDMTMPHMTGDELAEKIKGLRSDIPILLCTGYNENINETHTPQMPIDRYLWKPVEQAVMAKVIREVLKSYR